ncbi:hypothetical protein AAIQ89_004263 [Salmonella enterica]|uniref:hypothetical protein n=2 Tax=Enterobacterales TaxID=91347 RepID=UPI0008FD3E7E|nr:hypothetical protein [Salmonella enterica]EAA7727473.1 hypothetical protein [Salmonella enterica subsp. enterica serovar Pomona]EAM4339442.1 hypothetical protein [Salmonella enterica subsp. enterica serovar Minnesota]EAN3246922.1 hypothetical protein [Salmonella enterica subsp. enterica serovar Give]EAU5127053.1 hypothetical protein [Salmonella enterica subsp. enterica serovar Infantis]EBL6567194.1 hypothetical protein [Salmonella enterica subsp. enterica serovar Muenchen]EBP4105912.1 hypo
MTHVFVYLVIASSVHGGSSWNVTPMPNMDVCKQFSESITKPRGFDLNFPRASLVRCVEVKTDKPVNPQYHINDRYISFTIYGQQGKRGSLKEAIYI